MKCDLKIVSDGVSLEIEPESDVEIIALRIWSEKFFEVETKSNGAYLLIKTRPTLFALDAAVPPSLPCHHGAYGSCPQCGTNEPPRQ